MLPVHTEEPDIMERPRRQQKLTVVSGSPDTALHQIGLFQRVPPLKCLSERDGGEERVPDLCSPSSMTMGYVMSGGNDERRMFTL